MTTKQSHKTKRRKDKQFAARAAREAELDRAHRRFCRADPLATLSLVTMAAATGTSLAFHGRTPVDKYEYEW